MARRPKGAPMSDAPQGPDWWQASDDKWYPPPRPEMPGDVPASSPPVGAQGYAAPRGAPGGPPLGPPSGAYAPVGPPSQPYPPGPPLAGPGYPPGPPSGPYGAPGGPPGPPGSPTNRTPLFVALGALGAVAVVGLILVVSSGDGDDEPHGREPVPTTPTTPGTEVTTTEPDAPPETGGGDSTSDVADLALVDQGFSVSDDGGNYGIIIANNGSETVTNFTVQVAVYDPSDTVVTTDDHTVAKLGPGEQLGIGYDLFSEDTGNGVARLDVQFEEGFGGEVPEGSFTVSEVATTTDESVTETTFVVASTYQVDLDSPYAYAIYRDSAGKIIGGTYGFVDMIPASGRASGTITSFDPVDGVATTEVYVDMGLFV
jgi:hypothetical protein